MDNEPHAVTRARERYGIELSRKDLAHLALRCRAKEGVMERFSDGRTQHVIIRGNRVLWVLYRSPEAGSPRDCGTVITVLPAQYAERRVKEDHRFYARRKNGHAKRSQFA